MVNFFNYLLHHDVCPDYAKEIKETRNFIIKTKAEQDLEDLGSKSPSKSAEQELIAIHNLGPKFPGEFAVACSVVLGGNLAESHGNGSITWAEEKDHTGMSVEKARLVLASAITLFGSSELADVLYPGSELSVDKLDMAEVYRLGLEVIEIELLNEDVIKYYADMNEFYKKEKKTMSAKPLGKLVCKPWAVPTFEDPDLPKHLRNETFQNPPDTYTFWLEGEILQEVFVGMKMSAEVRRLVGQGCEESVWVLDGVNSLYCSFYSLILNELMPHPHKEVRLLTAEEQAAEATDGDDGS
jgi:hypothetical protein